MLRQEEFKRTHAEVRTGMTAYDINGERLGIIEDIDDDGITIEKGRIFHRDVHVPYEEIEDVRADDVIIRQGREGMEEREDWKPESGMRREAPVTETSTTAPKTEVEPIEGREFRETEEPQSMAQPGPGLKVPMRSREEEMREPTLGEKKEVSIPVREEELGAEKRQREGEVRVHKDVYTETQRMEVPVEKEEVHVEHVPAGEARAAETDENAFKEQDIRIPVKEEVVEVTKRPVVKEEIRVSKEAHTEEEEVSGEVRKEKVKVERTAPTTKR